MLCKPRAVPCVAKACISISIVYVIIQQWSVYALICLFIRFWPGRGRVESSISRNSQFFTILFYSSRTPGELHSRPGPPPFELLFFLHFESFSFTVRSNGSLTDWDIQNILCSFQDRSPVLEDGERYALPLTICDEI